MANLDDEEFATGEAGAALDEPKQCSALRVNGYVVIKNRPCLITSMSTSKTGKHGAAKVHLTGVDIFTNKKYEEQSSSTSMMRVPKIARKDYQLMDIKDGFLSLMSEDCEMREDIPVPEGATGKEILDKWNNKGDDDTITVSVVAAMGEEQALRCRCSQQ
ncbi:unnamed protein product [Calicophoron daubneyi]|uniref:Eukaryotic translation initiation factor 5A n=1 Tax=Calicophoron daubneyi TaxID=300641 RepID=A0AAV2TBS2_CALDB